MTFVRTTAINKMLALKKRYKLIQGGTWAGKTYGIDSILVDTAAKNPGIKITVVAENIPAVKRGPLANFFEIMITTNRWIESHYNGSERIYTFTNGSTIEFSAYDTVGKAQAAGKRDVLFLNEAYYQNFEICDALMGRTSGDIWIDYNPHSFFWVNDEMTGREDVDLIILLPGDNEALPETIKQDHAIKREKAKTSEYWANWCKVFLDGQPGSSMGSILRNWELGVFNEKLPYYFGLDFGSKDPDALIKIAIDRANSLIYAKEEIYQNLLSTDDLAITLRDKIKKNVMNEFSTKSDEDMVKVNKEVSKKLIVADSAATRTIQDLQGKGLNVQPVVKGKIVDDVKLLYNWTIIVDPDSINLQKELNNWIWLDKKGEVPMDGNDHLIAGLRYITKTIILPTTRGTRGHKIFH